MFWGSFAGSEKGPSLFWEKEWKTIDSEKYCSKILPLIDGMVSMRPWLFGMQNNAPAHVSERTIKEFQERYTDPIDWPPYSPDLNPIEAVWDKMKDCVQEGYPSLGRGKQRTHDELRAIVQEAWNSVPDEYLDDLIDSMPERCRAVLEADRGPTKY